ncbi:MAG: hypothetical protein QF541_13685 [Lentisphaeria bacterium]|jgi:hypothetical protein|nr:hypothetical protein [Lentisphaeria bacterium]
MADNEQDQNDGPCAEAFYDSVNKSGTQELNIPAMYLRRLKDVNREFQQEDTEKEPLSPGPDAEDIPDAPGLFASGEEQIGSAPLPDSPPITISSEPAPAEDAEPETAEPADPEPGSTGEHLNLPLPPKPS